MNWANMARAFPIAYEDWIQSGEDFGVFTKKNGIMAYMYDPSLVRDKSGVDMWMWEIKYLNKEWSFISLTDLIPSSESKAFESMVEAIFKTVESKQCVTMSDYEKFDREFKPEDWEKAKRDVEGLMGLYTKKAVQRHKRKKFFQAKVSRSNK